MKPSDRASATVSASVLLLIVLAAATQPLKVEAQSTAPQIIVPKPTVISGLPCSTCKVIATRHARIGAVNEPGTIMGAPLQNIHLAGRGRIIIIGEDSLPQLWSLDGQFQKSIGKKGDGPGEFREFPRSLIVGPGDSLWMFQGLAVSVFTEDGRFGRSFRTDMFVSPFFLRGGRLLVYGIPVSGPGDGPRLHTMDANGTFLSSFGRPQPVAPGSAIPLAYAPIRIALPGGDFWTRDGVNYSLFRWRADGTVLRFIQRDAPWYVTRLNRAADSQIPVSQLSDAHLDSKGRIWTMTKVASTNWRQYSPSAVAGRRGGEMSLSAIEYEKLFDTMVEVLDVEAGRVLADIRIPGHPLNFLGDGFLATLESNADDVPLAQIWRVSVPGG